MKLVPDWAKTDRVDRIEPKATGFVPAPDTRSSLVKAIEKAARKANTPEGIAEAAEAEIARQERLRAQREAKEANDPHPMLYIDLINEDGTPFMVDGQYITGAVRADRIQDALTRLGQWQTRN